MPNKILTTHNQYPNFQARKRFWGPKIKVMSNKYNDELMENLFEMFIEAGYTNDEAEKAVLETFNLG